MITVRMLQDIPDQGLFEGDLLSVDKFSAAAMVKLGKAEEYNADEAREAAAPDDAEYGGQKAATIDDIHDPEAHHDRRVQTAVHVMAADPGPPQQAPAALAPADVEPNTDIVDPPKSSRSKKEASGAEPAGGDAGGGDGTS